MVEYVYRNGCRRLRPVSGYYWRPSCCVWWRSSTNSATSWSSRRSRSPTGERVSACWPSNPPSWLCELGQTVELWRASGCSVVECRTCNREVAGSTLGRDYFAPTSTQPSIPGVGEWVPNCGFSSSVLQDVPSKGGGALCAGNAVALLVFGPVMP